MYVVVLMSTGEKCTKMCVTRAAQSDFSLLTKNIAAFWRCRCSSCNSCCFLNSLLLLLLLPPSIRTTLLAHNLEDSVQQLITQLMPLFITPTFNLAFLLTARDFKSCSLRAASSSSSEFSWLEISGVWTFLWLWLSSTSAVCLDSSGKHKFTNMKGWFK